MPATVIDLPVEQGATFRRTILWTTPDPEFPTDEKKRIPVNVTGWGPARMQVRRKQGTPLLIELDSRNPAEDENAKGGITIGGADGAIALVMTHQQTNLLTASSAVYDLEIDAPNGDRFRVAKGKLTVGDQIALRGVFSKVLSKNRPFNLINNKIASAPSLRDLKVTQFVVDDGWMAIAIGYPEHLNAKRLQNVRPR